jgi:hypothetical protein
MPIYRNRAHRTSTDCHFGCPRHAPVGVARYDKLAAEALGVGDMFS